MNKAEIIQELRRSACEDECPYFQANYFAWRKVVRACERPELSGWMYDLDIRTLFLLVACALEDE